MTTGLDVTGLTPEEIAAQLSCSVDVTLSVIGGKWKLVIYYHLRNGITRFGQLKRAIPRITQTMLTQQLRELEDDGIITRTIFPEIPPRVEYEVTEFGLSLECVIKVMCDWGERYKEMVLLKKIEQNELPKAVSRRRAKCAVSRTMREAEKRQPTP